MQVLPFNTHCLIKFGAYRTTLGLNLFIERYYIPHQGGVNIVFFPLSGSRPETFWQNLFKNLSTRFTNDNKRTWRLDTRLTTHDKPHNTHNTPRTHTTQHHTHSSHTKDTHTHHRNFLSHLMTPPHIETRFPNNSRIPSSFVAHHFSSQN
jgi:hypothetical protein